MIVKEMKHRLISHRPPIGQVSNILKGTNYKFTDTKRVERVFKLIVYLNEFRTYKEIAKHLEVSRRTSSRYIHLLLHLGFEIERNMSKHFSFKIVNTKDYFKG